jgi:predicted transcriptional regulator
MKLREIVEKLDLEVVVGKDLEREVKGGYIGDLLSNVMAGAREGDIWLTVQGHQNVVAVALLTEVAGVVVVEGLGIDEKAIERAEEKGINLLRSNLTAYQLASKLTELGIK